MLLDGFNHVALLTKDTDRLASFYREGCSTPRSTGRSRRTSMSV